MQDPKDETKFCIVERYEQESSQQYHLNNPVRISLSPSITELTGSTGR
jgi:quinol monooxygenase YgiN